jgi:hypothetical protein
MKLTDRLSGPYKWGYRDVTDGAFIVDNAPYEAAAEIGRLQAALTLERERCAQLVLARARLWNDHARAGHPGDCAESLADECEDIVAAIRRP